MSKGLVDTKKEYVNFLQDLLAVPIAEKIYDIYIECQSKGLRQFQKELNKIPEWNNHIIQEEADIIVEKSQCDYLDKILKITITSSVKLKFSEYTKKLNAISVKTPSVNDFIHKCFVYASQFAWKHSYLFIQTNLKPVEIQNNMNIIEHEIRVLVARSIADYVNVRDVVEQLDKLIEKSRKKKKKINVIEKRKTPMEPVSDYESDDVNETDNNISTTELGKMCEKEFQDYRECECMTGGVCQCENCDCDNCNCRSSVSQSQINEQKNHENDNDVQEYDDSKKESYDDEKDCEEGDNEDREDRNSEVDEVDEVDDESDSDDDKKSDSKNDDVDDDEDDEDDEEGDEEDDEDDRDNDGVDNEKDNDKSHVDNGATFKSDSESSLSSEDDSDIQSSISSEEEQPKPEIKIVRFDEGKNDIVQKKKKRPVFF